MRTGHSEAHQETIDTLGKSVSKKLKMPVYLSFNVELGEEMLLKRIAAHVRKYVYELFETKV
jgi:glutamate formiminotransferase